MNKFRKDVLLCTLYRADEELLGKELVLYLDENVPLDKTVTPECLMSVCLMFWSTSPKLAPTGRQMEEIKTNLTAALAFAWSLHKNIQKIKAKDQKNRMRGWRISEAHRLRKIAEAFNVPVK